MNFPAITKKEFETNLSSNFSFEKQPYIGICVSGGCDSMALLLLMREWIKKLKGRILAIHFDHNLRIESNFESKVLEKKVKKLGVDFTKITWNHTNIDSRILEVARNERYKKIISYCKKHKIINLMTAHNLDDNLETFLMRKKRDNISLGLSSIPKIRVVDDLRIIRPLLIYEKARLEATCKKSKIQWLVDKSNFDERFERVRVRNFLKSKNVKCIESINSELRKRKDVNLVKEKKILKFFCKELRFYDYGVFKICREKFNKQSKTLKIEILKKILTTAGGRDFSPKRKSILYFLSLEKRNESFNFTLHTCLLKVCKNNIKILKEISNKRKVEKFFLKKGKKTLWQNRFIIESKIYDLEMNNITQKNWPSLKKKIDSKNSKLDFLVIQSLPLIILNGDRVVPFLSENKYLEQLGIKFYFFPKVPLQKKNFF